MTASLLLWSALAASPEVAPGRPARLTLTSEPSSVATVVLTALDAGPITVEARSLDLDVKVAIFDADGAKPVAEDDNGLGGTDAVAGIEAAAGARYRIEVRPADETEEARGEVTISVRAGSPPPAPEADAAAARDLAYWNSVEEGGDPWRKVRGRLGRATLALGRGAYAEMIPLCDDAAAAARAAWGAADGRYGVAVATGGLARYLSGDLTAARPMIADGLAVIERRYGEDDMRTAMSLNYLGEVDEDLGELRLARDDYERSLAIRERLHGKDQPESVAALGNLGGLIDELGDPETAHAYYERALAIQEKSSPGSARIASLLNNVAFEMKKIGRTKDAVPLYERALAIRRDKLGDEHPSTALSLQNLAMALHETGRTAEAVPMLEQSMAIRERKLGPDHPDLAVSLSNLARVDYESGHAADALPLIERALAIREAKLGPSHPDTARAEVLRARVLAALGKTDEAIDAAIAAEAVSRADVRRIARFLPESTSLAYAAKRARGLDVAIATAAAPGARVSQERLRRVWECALRSRALVLDEMARRARAVRKSGDPATRAAEARLVAAVSAWGRLVTEGAGKKGDPRAAFDAARSEVEAAERALAEASADFRREVQAREPSLEDVRRPLTGGTALVAYATYDAGTETAPKPCYAAFVLEGGTVALRPLGDAGAIDGRIARWRAAVGGAAADVETARAGEKESRRLGADLRGALWDPVAPSLGKTKSVVIVPDGAVHLAPLGALPDGDGYLVESGILFQYVTAERDLLGGASPPAGGVLAMGGPEMPAPAAGSEGCGPASLPLPPLPNAAREAEEIGAIFGGTSRVLTGAQATAAAFRTLAPQAGVLHLATHGIVLGARCPSRGRSALEIAGLALADGVLTAEEIASIDLSRVRFAALSSCDSGGGTVADGEGVLGLRRAFAIAGAKTLVLTLWPVDDRDARRFMTAAYRARFKNGEPAAGAARDASLEILKDRRKRGLDTGPIHWGAFVAAGS
ncbi:MAG TPA: CHAT domain-containing tetratricopeptide repeat protein [Candidatus Polarisedimenticolaceae bacterium]|nr:CHAT domain-containing tetratricopeptide repeat protein [Candidatus Polarisedimenticolaceae bacterium]